MVLDEKWVAFQKEKKNWEEAMGISCPQKICSAFIDCLYNFKIIQQSLI
jgi:hypothetical protein